jgi:glycosyltransferase involved in cell wall biosynthesis
MKKKIVSVIIAAYNAEFFIADAIRSVLLQELPRDYCLEIIVGIDGCRKTWNSVAEFRRFGVRIVRMSFNYGPYITFNTIMNYGSGDLIARFDADDVMLPGYLCKQIELFASSPGVKMSRTWSIYTDPYFSPMQARLANGRYTGADGKRNSGSDGQFMMAREVWDKLGAFKPWKCFADTDFLLRCRLAGYRMREVQEHLYIRRVHPGSLTVRKETSYNSRARLQYKNKMELDRHGYLNGQSIFVTPASGYIDCIL